MADPPGIPLTAGKSPLFTRPPVLSQRREYAANQQLGYRGSSLPVEDSEAARSRWQRIGRGIRDRVGFLVYLT